MPENFHFLLFIGRIYWKYWYFWQIVTSLTFERVKMASKVEGTCKQRSLHAFETILTGRLLPKVTIIRQRVVINYYKELWLKTSRKGRHLRDICATWKSWKDSWIVRPKTLTKNRWVSFSEWILGNDKGVGVPVYTKGKMKTTKKRNIPEWKGNIVSIKVRKAYIIFSPHRCVRFQKRS